jgi:hypothetical protein
MHPSQRVGFQQNNFGSVAAVRASPLQPTRVCVLHSASISSSAVDRWTVIVLPLQLDYRFIWRLNQI